MALCVWVLRNVFTSGSKVAGIYGSDVVTGRHRHRWEFNNDYLTHLSNAGLKVAGRSIDETLVEVVEVDDHHGLSVVSSTPNLLQLSLLTDIAFTSFVGRQSATRRRARRKSCFHEICDNIGGMPCSNTHP